MNTSTKTLLSVVAAHAVVLGAAFVSMQNQADRAMLAVVAAEPIVVTAKPTPVVKAARIEVRASATVAKRTPEAIYALRRVPSDLA
jgi:hypothetical protein